MIPHNLETEKALLGSILIDEAQFDIILEYVHTPEMFYNDTNKEIFAVMLALKNNRQTIDLITVADKMPGAVEYIATLTNYTVTSAHAGDYAKQVADKHLRRELFRACEEGKRIALDETECTANDAASAIGALIMKASRGLNISGAGIDTLTTARFEKYLQDAEQGVHWEGIKTGFVDIDEYFDGFALGENIILAARPSMGKTALALNIASNAAKAGVQVSFFSMEMSKERLADRLLCAEAQVDAKRMRTRKLTEAEVFRLEEAYNTLLELPIHIYDGSMNTAQIRSSLARVQGKGLAVIDFLTLLTDHPTLSAHERYGTIAKTIQSMAAAFKMPILTLAQLNRKVEDRQDKHPMLSDLRESGNLEEAADKVIFIYRDDYYSGKNKGVAEIICAKNRDGETGAVELTWRPEVLRFGNMAKGER